MRRLSFLAAFLAAAPVAPAAAPSEMVGRREDGFVLAGKPFAAVGLNCYYLMTRAASPGLRNQVDEVLDQARALGATVVRTWAFNDGADQWNALQLSPGVYSETVFAGLDYVVKAARDRGLRLLLPLVNNWNDYGGMNRYVAWSDTAERHDDFYTDPACRQWYRDHVKKVLTRVNTLTGTAYRDDPAIFGWELANEPRAAEAGAAALDAWIAEMAAYLKSVDPHHLLSIGSEGFYGPAAAARNPGSWMAREGVDFLANHSHPGVDFASFHLYPDHWSVSSEQAVKWIGDHLADGKSILGKPVLLGEFGKRQPIAARDEFFGACYREVLAGVAPGSARAGALFWILYADSYPDYDGFGVYYRRPEHASTVRIIESMQEAITARIAPDARFIRADANCDGGVDLADAVAGLLALFAGSSPPCCAAALDSNGDSAADLADPVYLLGWLFQDRPAPPPPFPGCGPAPDPGGCQYTGCAR